VRFWVLDNGTGLTLENQKKLFAQFSRLEQARAEGHGLGLSIVQRIVARLGGTVGVESAVGQGSRFYFTLKKIEDTANDA
jgi:signal transduction histidine kinase